MIAPFAPLPLGGIASEAVPPMFQQPHAGAMAMTIRIGLELASISCASELRSAPNTLALRRDHARLAADDVAVHSVRPAGAPAVASVARLIAHPVPELRAGASEGATSAGPTSN